MNINYLILIHKSPTQVKRLIGELKGNGVNFFLHIDKKEDIKPFKEALKDLYNISYVPEEKRVAGQWGGIELVEATLNLIEMIPGSEQKSYNILLSGQDYPIKSTTYIHKFLEVHYGTEYMDIFPIPSKKWWPAPYGLDRLNKYIFRKSAARYDFVLFPSLMEKEFYKPFFLKELAKLTIRGNFGFLKKLFRKRQFPNYLKPYGGHQWWALTAETLEKIKRFLKEHSDYLLYHRDSLVPDEIFFQSILKYILPPGTLTKPCLTYANWERKIDVLPVTFTADDINEITKQPASILYARKFDISIDKQILNMIDEAKQLYAFTKIQS